jgi:septal ring factor EnvC (AmiA/AmiB activator)
MNANELADLLETTESTNNRAATMLRQQADRIAELEKQLDDMAGELMSLENSQRFEAGYGHN